jgi:hypothetical protein
VRLRRLLLGGFVAFALLGAAVAGVWSLGGEAWLARRALESALGRPVEIDGGVEVALGAAPTLRLAGLRVANPGWATAPSFLQVERAEVQIALGPLLRQVVLLPRVACTGCGSTSRPRRRAGATGSSNARHDLERRSASPWLGSCRSTA